MTAAAADTAAVPATTADDDAETTAAHALLALSVVRPVVRSVVRSVAVSALSRTSLTPPSPRLNFNCLENKACANPVSLEVPLFGVSAVFWQAFANGLDGMALGGEQDLRNAQLRSQVSALAGLSTAAFSSEQDEAGFKA